MNENYSDLEDPYLLLDSKHITATDIKSRIKILANDKPKIYDFKVVQCGSYIQVYHYLRNRVKTPAKDDDIDLNLNSIDFDISDSKKKIKTNISNNIELRSIVRSKLQCQRIAKANMEHWKTFITLTFKENVKDIDYANKKFHNFITVIKRHYKDFKYLCVPEYQKRGAVHYHLLTNLECATDLIPKRPLKRLYNRDSKTWKELEYYDLKYWNAGFSSAECVTGDVKKIIGYISKYMTKDIDNRLFGHRRFFYSQNCNVPKVSYIDSMDSRDFEFLQKKIQGKELIYQNEYLNTYDDSKVSFQEYLPH